MSTPEINVIHEGDGYVILRQTGGKVEELSPSYRFASRAMADAHAEHCRLHDMAWRVRLPAVSAARPHRSMGGASVRPIHGGYPHA